MRRAVASALLATGLAAALVACQGRPADSVALSLYHRNLSDEPFDVVASLSAEDAGNPATVAVAFTIAPDGTVVIGGGVPAWWDADVQTCPGA